MEADPIDKLVVDSVDVRAEAGRLASNHAAEMGAALVDRDRTGEAVLAMAEAGAEPDEVMAGLVMAGLAKRVTRLRDRIPGFGRRHAQVYELVDRSHITAYPD